MPKGINSQKTNVVVIDKLHHMHHDQFSQCHQVSLGFIPYHYPWICSSRLSQSVGSQGCCFGERFQGQLITVTMLNPRCLLLIAWIINLLWNLTDASVLSYNGWKATRICSWIKVRLDPPALAVMVLEIVQINTVALNLSSPDKKIPVLQLENLICMLSFVSGRFHNLYIYGHYQHSLCWNMSLESNWFVPFWYFSCNEAIRLVLFPTPRVKRTSLLNA